MIERPIEERIRTRTGRLAVPAVATFLLVGVVYGVFAEMAWSLYGASDVGVSFFPAAGVTLAALVILPRRRWPAVLMAVAVAETIVDVANGVQLAPTLGFVAANTSEPLVGAIVIGRFAGRTSPPILRLPSRESAFAFAVGGILTGPFVGATIGASTRWLVSGGSYLSYFVSWWVGDALGVLAVGSAIVVFADPTLRGSLRTPRAFAVVACVAIAAVWVVRTPWLTSYLAIPLLLVLAFYGGIAGVAVGGLITAVVANVTTALGTGAFAQVEGISAQQQLVDTQLLVGAALAAAYLLAIEVAEHERADRERLAEHAARMRAESMEAVGSLSRQLANADTIEEMVRAFMRHVEVRLAPIGSGINLVGEDGRFHELHAEGVPDEVRMESLRYTLDSPLPGPVAARTGTPVFIESRQELDRRFPTLSHVAGTAALAAAALAAIPLAHRSGPAGYLILVWDTPRAFEGAERVYLAALGDVVGQSIDRVRLREREHGLAVELQHAMLGVPDEIDGVELATAYRPADSAIEVGGDWYDAVRLNERETAFVVGDVVGHNLSAAKAMGRIRISIRTLAPLFPDPATLLARLEPVVADIDGAAPTTLLYAVLDTWTHRLRFSCAGHPPPLVARADGDVSFLHEGRGLPLGIAPSERTVGETTLEPGDALILYTDGLVERRDEPIDEGLLRLAARVASAGSTDPTAVRDELLRELGPAEDDIAVLVVATRPQLFVLEVPVDPGALRDVRVDVGRWLQGHGLTGTFAEDVILATHEAVANAMEHAYAGATNGAQPVTVSMWREAGGALAIEVRDHGAWREGDADPTRGRGLPLMAALMDDVALRKQPDGTVVRMRAVPREGPVEVAAT